MFDLAINHLPYKLPIAATTILVIALTGVHMLGLMEVEIGKMEGRLLLLLSFYLMLLSAIIWLHKKMTDKVKLHF